MMKLTEEQIWKCNQTEDGVHICLDHQNVVDFARSIEREIGFSKAEHAMRETQRLGQEIEQEPVAMRMPKVGDAVVCIEDDSLGEVAYLTAGGSPEIKFDDGSHGTYLLREFAELFRYATPPQRNEFKPDYNTEAVLVEEMQRMAQRIAELEALLERQTARILDLQTHIENFDGEDR